MSFTVYVQVKAFVLLDELHYSSSQGMEIKMVIGFDFLIYVNPKCGWFLIFSSEFW